MVTRRRGCSPLPDYRARIGSSSDTIHCVSRGLKVVLFIVLVIMLGREMAFRRNLADFDPDTAPFGD